MKLSLLFVAILGVATVSAVPTGKDLTRQSSLADDLDDFIALLPADEILEVAITYLAEDSEVQAVVEYVLSEDFKTLVLAVENIPEYIRFLNYLQAAGLDVYKWVNKLHALLGIEDLTVPKTLAASRLVSARNTGGIAGLWAEIKALLPLKELRALHEEKLETSKDYLKLSQLLTSPEAQVIYDALKANKEYQYIREKLSGHGLDIDLFFDWIKALIGWGA